jgi:hypothetical protein
MTLGQGARTELAMVKWVKPGKGDTQIVGCSFVHPLTSHEFKALYLSALLEQTKTPPLPGGQQALADSHGSATHYTE